MTKRSFPIPEVTVVEPNNTGSYMVMNGKLMCSATGHSTPGVPGPPPFGTGKLNFVQVQIFRRADEPTIPKLPPAGLATHPSTDSVTWQVPSPDSPIGDVTLAVWGTFVDGNIDRELRQFRTIGFLMVAAAAQGAAAQGVAAVKAWPKGKPKPFILKIATEHVSPFHDVGRAQGLGIVERDEIVLKFKKEADGVRHWQSKATPHKPGFWQLSIQPFDSGFFAGLKVVESPLIPEDLVWAALLPKLTGKRILFRQHAFAEPVAFQIRPK